MNNSNEIHYQEQTILILQRSMHREIVARQLTVSMISHMAKSLISSDKTSKIAQTDAKKTPSYRLPHRLGLEGFAQPFHVAVPFILLKILPQHPKPSPMHHPVPAPDPDSEGCASLVPENSLPEEDTSARQRSGGHNVHVAQAHTLAPNGHITPLFSLDMSRSNKLYTQNLGCLILSYMGRRIFDFETFSSVVQHETILQPLNLAVKLL